jgi:hypothetical protein
MLGTEHFFFHFDGGAKLGFRLGILTLIGKRACQIVARGQCIRVLRTERFFFELDDRAKLRFSLGILAFSEEGAR